MTFRDYNNFQITREFLAYVFGHITVQNTGYKTDCWLWTRKDGQLIPFDTYCAIWRNNIAYVAHRVMVALFIEPIRDPKNDIDHLCRIHSCVNPSHLEQVTAKENILRGTGVCATNAKKTHCHNGHELTAENTYIEPTGGGRKCRICRNVSATAKRRRDGKRELRTTHCWNNHERTPQNTSITPSGMVVCLTCKNIRQRAKNRENGIRPWPTTHCYRGHEYTPENTYITTKGSRQCRECRRTSVANRKAQIKAAPIEAPP